MIRGRASGSTKVSRESRAYRDGWEDGRFRSSDTVTSNTNLSSLDESERLAYYRGHREGRKIREMLRGAEVHA